MEGESMSREPHLWFLHLWFYGQQTICEVVKGPMGKTLTWWDTMTTMMLMLVVKTKGQLIFW